LDSLGVLTPKVLASDLKSRLFDNGGYAVLRRGNTMAVLRYPRFQFRPSHSDALHVDLWVDGENLLRDAGTFSYCENAAEMECFAGVRGHTTVQFDEREPMPRLGRFLFGDWLKTVDVESPDESAGALTCGAKYQDREGASHSRKLSLRMDRLCVRDEIGGFKSRAVFRWRLRPGPWRVDGQCVTDGRHHVTIASDLKITRIELIQGWESRYYLQKTEVPVLEVEVNKPGVLLTEYCWIA
jgi:hypothetical protein